MRFSNDPKDIGTKLGPKLVHLVSQAVVSTKLRLLDTEHRARVISQQTIIDRAGKEIADHHREIMEMVLADRELPPEVKKWLDRTMSGRHQWQAAVGYQLLGSGTGGSLGTIISNFLAPGVRFAVGKDPQLTPSNEEMITAVVKGAMDHAKASDLAAGNGWSQDLVDEIAETIRQYPPLAETLELLRRGLISQSEAELYLTRNGIPASVHGPVLALRKQILSPADLADMVVRGIKTEGEAAAVAAESGFDAADFNAIVLDTGEPPGLQQMLEGYRRHFIDRATLERGIRQSRYRDEWIPLLEELRYTPMSVADAVTATIQNHITPDAAASIADQNGLAPGFIDTLIQSAGEPLSRGEMSELVNRGEATEAEFTQAMRESRVKDKYIPLAFLLRRRIPPAREIGTALSRGVIDNATAIRKIMDYGYNQPDAEVIVKSAAHVKLASHKANITSSVIAAYEQSLLSRDEALALVEQMGYDKAEATFIIEGADFRQSARTIAQVVAYVRSHYLARRIDRNAASGELDTLGLPAANRDMLLHAWDLELAVNVRSLTPAEIIKAVKKQLITPDAGLARLEALGYSSDDAILLLEGA